MSADVTHRDTQPVGGDPSLARAQSRPPQGGARHPAQAPPRTDNPYSPPVSGSSLSHPCTCVAGEIRDSGSDQLSRENPRSVVTITDPSTDGKELEVEPASLSHCDCSWQPINATLVASYSTAKSILSTEHTSSNDVPTVGTRRQHSRDEQVDRFDSRYNELNPRAVDTVIER